MRFKQTVSEGKSRKRLKTLIDPNEYVRYERFGYCVVEGAIFGMMELVGTPTGWYCVTIESPEPLPHTDRLIHRLMLWRKGEDNFYKIANQQI